MVLRAQGLVLVCEDIVRREKLVVLVVSRQSDANLLRLLQAEDFHCIVVRPNLPGFHCSVMKGFLGCIIHRLPKVFLACSLHCKEFHDHPAQFDPWAIGCQVAHAGATHFWMALASAHPMNHDHQHDFQRLLSIDAGLMIEGSLEVKLPTIWTDEEQRWEELGKRREEERRSKKRKSQKKEDPGARKGRKAATHCVFPRVCWKTSFRPNQRPGLFLALLLASGQSGSFQSFGLRCLLKPFVMPFIATPSNMPSRRGSSH